jgi:integrase
MGGHKRGRRSKGEPPAMRRVKIRGAWTAYVSLQGKRHYLGRWGTQEARQRFRQVLDAWSAAEAAPAAWRPKGPVVTVADLVAAHALHAKVYYRHADGRPTTEVAAYRLSLAPLLKAHADMPVNELTKAHLRAIVSAWVAQGLARKTVNKMLARVQQVARWGAQEDLVDEATADRLDNVPPLPRGRSLARETGPVPPAGWWPTLAAFCRLPPQVQVMALVQLRTGARPGEVCAMRADEVHRGEVTVEAGEQLVTLAVPAGCWAWVPGQHKSRWRGKVAVYVVGPRLQSLLRPFLDAAGGGYVFPGKRSAHRAECWYWVQVAEACEAAGLPASLHWSPNQLRHSFLTRRKRKAGIDRARASVGHSSTKTTEVYIQRDLDDAARDAARWD